MLLVFVLCLVVGHACSASPCKVCTQPSTAGYNFDSAAGTKAIVGFAPSGVVCASGADTVTYAVCSGDGQDYSVSGCEVSPSNFICALLEHLALSRLLYLGRYSQNSDRQRRRATCIHVDAWRLCTRRLVPGVSPRAAFIKPWCQVVSSTF